MDTQKWNVLLNESINACDMTSVLQQTETWLNQGFDYWKAWNAMASSYAEPQKWLETAGGVSKTMEHYIQDWARIYGLDTSAAHEEAVAANENQIRETLATLSEIKKEKAALKRNLTQKDKTLKAQRSEVVQQQKRLKDKDKEIKELQAKIKSQAERLILLEAAKKNDSQPATKPVQGATVPQAGK